MINRIKRLFTFFIEEDFQYDPGKHNSQQYEQEDLVDHWLLLGQSGFFKFIQIKLDHLHIAFVQVESLCITDMVMAGGIQNRFLGTPPGSLSLYRWQFPMHWDSS